MAGFSLTQRRHATNLLQYFNNSIGAGYITDRVFVPYKVFQFLNHSQGVSGVSWTILNSQIQDFQDITFVYDSSGLENGLFLPRNKYSSEE